MRKHILKQPPKPPMLVFRTINNVDLETQERACILAFTHGVATAKHFDLINRINNLLMVAGQTDKKRKYALDFAETKIKPALIGIKNRCDRTGKLGVNAQELQALKDIVEFNREFWLKQTGELFVFCNEQVDAFYADLARRKK
jgi:hypothetical protein